MRLFNQSVRNVLLASTIVVIMATTAKAQFPKFKSPTLPKPPFLTPRPQPPKPGGRNDFRAKFPIEKKTPFARPPGGGKYLGKVDIPRPQPLNNNFNNFDGGNSFIPFGGQQQQQYDSGYDDEYYEPQPRRSYYQEPTYSQGGTSVTVAADLPPNAPPESKEPEPIELVDPHKNSIPMEVTIADAATIRKVGTELDLLLGDSVRKLVDGYASATLTDSAREGFLSENIRDDMDPALVTEMRSALIDLDAEAVELTAKKLGLSRRTIDTILPQTRFGGMLYELEKMVRSEDSVDKVDNYSRRFQTAMRDFDLDRSQREEVSSSVDAVLETLRIRLAMMDKPAAGAGAVVAAPEGTLPAVLYPPLAPAGKVFLAGPKVLLVGKDTAGEVVVSRARATELLELPRPSGEPVADTTTETASNPLTAGSVIYNPPELDRSIGYTINGTAYTAKSGFSQALPAGTTWVIAFDRGNKSEARYTLGEGCYAFREKDGALDIELHPCSVSIENPSPVGTFHFVVDNQHVELPAGESLSLKSKYPIVIGFYQGAEGKPVYKKLWGGKYSLALGGDDNLWNLYAADKVEKDSTKSTSTIPVTSR